MTNLNKTQINTVMPPVIALIVTGKQAFDDFVIFVKSLQTWHADAILYVYTDSPTQPSLAALKTTNTLHIRAALDDYAGLTRSDMEARPGRRYDSLFKDYTYEKAAVLRWALTDPAAKTGVWFNDSDIVHCAPLPAIPPTARVALSPHGIRAGDERLYGKYNAGFFWLSDAELLDVWIAAAPKSRFYEQAALEDVAAAAGTSLYEFPPSVNFGWWRMYQGAEPPAAIQARFSINRGDRSIGLRYDGTPLQSIHSHMDDRGTGTNGAFNKWFEVQTAKLSSHAPMRALRRIVGFK